jgi:dephospho-CoA kinase
MPSDRDAPVIVLTGGIASGKSMVAQMLRDCGAHVISADQIAREVVAPGKSALREIVQVFGPSMLTSKGDLDRRRLARLIFNNTKARRQLDEITHPQIWSLLDKRIKDARREASLVVVEIPLYFESGWSIPRAEVWVVYVDETTQLERLMSRDGLTHQEAEARINAQMLLIDKCALADWVIDNSHGKEETRAQVRRALGAIATYTSEEEER